MAVWHLIPVGLIKLWLSRWRCGLNSNINNTSELLTTSVPKLTHFGRMRRGLCTLCTPDLWSFRHRLLCAGKLTTIVVMPNWQSETLRSLSVCSFLVKLVNVNEPVFLQIGTSDPRGKGMKRSTSGIGRSKVKVIRGRSHFWRPGAYFLILTYRLRFCLWTWLELAI